MIIGLFMLTALPFSIYYLKPDVSQINLFRPDRDFWPLLLSGLATIFIGFILLITHRKAPSGLTKREGFIIVTSSWIMMSLFGALPFYLNGYITNYTDAFFETISGFTTTGATILPDVEGMPKGLLFWRSITQWLGGMGIIVLSLAILPFLGIGGMSLFMAEAPGPTSNKLHPRIIAAAKRLWGIYALLTAIETVLLLGGGMNLLDALSHAFATMATGGFSTHNASIAAFSPYIQYVIMVFMLLAGTNFTLHYMALQGKLKDVFRNEEYRYFLLIIFGFATFLGLKMFFDTNLSFETTMRHTFFQVISIVTTTGFITSDYLLWPGNLWVIIFLLMFVGGSAGSTGGGIKVMRILLIFKNSFLEFKRIIHPNAIIPVRFNRSSVQPQVTYKIQAFFMFYIFIFGLSTLILNITGLDFKTAIGASAATLGNIGPGIGGVGPVENYATIPVIAKWFLSFLMLLGRLEIFTVLILLSPNFWKN
jgi:trk system potassium uptake protein TrkH